MIFFTILKFYWIKFWAWEVEIDYALLPTLMPIQIMPIG